MPKRFTIAMLSAALAALAAEQNVTTKPPDGSLRLLTGSEWQAAVEPADLKPRSVDPVAADEHKLGLGGFDAVAYFEDRRPTKGKLDLIAERGGVNYLFSSAAHREAFLREPDAYLPQYGGYCAYGIARGRSVAGNPLVWRIVSGRLYLFETHSLTATWERDNHVLIPLASGNWSTLRK